jgi:hypothetical protein
MFNILVELETSFNTSKQEISRQKEGIKTTLLTVTQLNLRTGDSDLPYIGNVINVN